ncbi:hypothetical protein AAMO2058_000189100 [Amorphochlora amoebiformis]
MSESKMEYGALESEEEGSDSVESPHDEKKSKSTWAEEINLGNCITSTEAMSLHAGYWVVAMIIIIILKSSIVDEKPTEEQSYLEWIVVGINFAKFYTTVLGIAFPMLLSIRALVTLETDDDHYWLTYWAVYALYTFLTIVFEEVMFEDTWLWYAVQGAIYVWLWLPKLHGCVIVSDILLRPYFLPILYRISAWVRSKVTLQLVFGSIINLAFATILFFVLIPYCATYIGVTLVGICYPFFASARQLAHGQEEGPEEDTNNPAKTNTLDSQWLTYWVVFAWIHFVNVWYDNLLDHSYWFQNLWYKVALPFMVWLQIPCFHGAEYIFLNIICPVFGLHVHRFQYASAPWKETPEVMNFITYSKDIAGFVQLVQAKKDVEKKSTDQAAV